MERPKPHPAKSYMAAERVTVTEVARRHNFSVNYVSRALNGWVPASPRLRGAVAEELGLPEVLLFRDDAPAVSA